MLWWRRRRAPEPGWYDDDSRWSWDLRTGIGCLTVELLFWLLAGAALLLYLWLR